MPATRKVGKAVRSSRTSLPTEDVSTQPWQRNIWGCLGWHVIKHESILEENNSVLPCPPFDNSWMTQKTHRKSMTQGSESRERD